MDEHTAPTDVIETKVLVVDDDASLGKACKEVLEEAGYSIVSAGDGAAALDAVRGDRQIRLALVDLKLPDVDGVDLLRKIKSHDAGIEVIIMTGHGTIERAVESMRVGAADFVTKPFGRDVLLHTVERTLKLHHLELEVAKLQSELQQRYRFDNILGKNHKMQEVFDLIIRVSDSEANVLIEGETGTGKELVARAIHYNSPRRNGPFVKVDCATLSETLLESELFV